MARGNRLTNEELEEIRERLGKVTGHMWDTFSEFIDDEKTVYGYDELTETGDSIIAECETEEDADFIAHVREDIPKLLAEIERLQGERDGLIGMVYENVPEYTELYQAAERMDDE